MTFQKAHPKKELIPFGQSVDHSNRPAFLRRLCPQRHSDSIVIPLWDEIPRWVFGKQTDLREYDTFLKTITRRFTLRNREYEITIYPARIVDAEGTEIEYFPGAREQIIELALRKLAVDGQSLWEQGRLTAYFTLYQLQKLLKTRKHSFSYPQILESLQKLTAVRLDLAWYDQGKRRELRGLTYLSLMGTDDTNLPLKASRRFVIFSQMINDAIAKQRVRPCNFDRCLQHRTAGQRYLELRLSAHYRQAHINTSYHIKVSTLVSGSGLCTTWPLRQQAKYWLDTARSLADIDGSEVSIIGGVLPKKQLLKNPQTGRLRLEDVVITLLPTLAFSQEMKRWNATQ